MRRTGVVLLLSLLLSPVVAFSQIVNWTSNNYFSVSLGPGIYSNDAGTSIGGGASIHYGKWLLSDVGLRARLSYHYFQDAQFAYGNAEIFFDPITALKGQNPSNIMRTYLYTGIGLVHSFTGDNDFCGSLGLGADWRVGDDWRLSVELGARILPYNFNSNTKNSFTTTMEFGAVRDINFNPTRSRSRYETKKLSRDWFFEVALGACSFNYRGIASNKERLELLMPNFEFGLGKRLTNTWAVRFAASGLYARSSYEVFTYYNVHGDVILDLCGWLVPDRGTTLVDLKPYASACVVSRLDSQSQFLFSVGGGSLLSLRPNSNHEITLDLRYVLTPSRFAHTETAQGQISVGLATVLLGYSYIFSGNSFARVGN